MEYRAAVHNGGLDWVCGPCLAQEYSSVSDMFDILGWPPLSQKRQEARLILFYKIINGLAQVPFEGDLVEAYKGTRRKHNMKFRQIDHKTSQYGQSFFLKLLVHEVGLLSLKLRHWLYLDHNVQYGRMVLTPKSLSSSVSINTSSFIEYSYDGLLYPRCITLH